MVAEPKRKPDPMFGRKWNHRYTVHRRPSLMARLRSSWAVRLAAGSTAALTATGGMAYAGVLPDPVQEAVSDLVQKIGVDVPSPSDEGSTSDAVHEVTERKSEFDSGKEFGHSVRDAAHKANAERKANKDERKAAKRAEKKDGVVPSDGSVPSTDAEARKNDHADADKDHPVKDEGGKNSDKGKPESPGNSDEHGKAEEPTEPEEPESPGKSDEDHGQPESPSKAGADHGKPESPGKPEKPEKPEKPGKDS
jgi:hypothetical protein